MVLGVLAYLRRSGPRLNNNPNRWFHKNSACPVGSVRFARGPIAPHPEHVTATNCRCLVTDVATLKFSLAQKGQARNLIVVGIRVV